MGVGGSGRSNPASSVAEDMKGLVLAPVVVDAAAAEPIPMQILTAIPARGYSSSDPSTLVVSRCKHATYVV